MSQPSNDAEVDQVLSAIRRLIEDGRPEGPGAATAPLDRLVLTPAQRVETPARPLSVPETLVLRQVEQALPPTSDPLVLLNALPAAPLARLQPDAGARPGESGAPEASGSTGPDVPDATGTPAPEASPPVARLAPDAEEIDLTSDPGALEAAREAEPHAPAPTASTPPDPEQADLSNDPGALEAASPPWPDEAALRALVAEALREELRGELGERLTRNLRKLVRREVMQALAARDA